MMQNLFSTESLSAKEPKTHQTPLKNKISYDYDSKNDERHPDSPSYQGIGTRDESEPGVDGNFKGSVLSSVLSSSQPSKLFSLINKRNWPAVVKRCRGEDAKETKTWISETNRDGSIRWKSLPIHQACEKNAPSEVIRALVAAHPDSLLMKDAGGDLPIHLACRERSSKSVIGVLLSEEPESAKVKDEEGRLPLHLACRQGTAIQIVDSLIICFFRGTHSTDEYDLLPIHWACAQNASPAIVEALLRANPSSTDLKDKWGRTPISLAQASTNPERDAVIEALNQDPSYWNTNLAEEIQDLTHKLEQTSNKEKESKQKVQELRELTKMKLKKMEEESELKLKKMEEESELRLQKMEEESKLKIEEVEKSSTQKIMKIEEGSEMNIKKVEEEAEMKVRDIEEEANMKLKKLEAEANMKLMQLEGDNEKLRDEVRVLSSTNKYGDDDVEKMNEENYKLSKDIRKYQSKLKGYAQVFETMELQRLSLLKITKEMELAANQLNMLTGSHKKYESKGSYNRTKSAKKTAEKIPDF